MFYAIIWFLLSNLDMNFIVHLAETSQANPLTATFISTQEIGSKSQNKSLYEQKWEQETVSTKLGSSVVIFKCLRYNTYLIMFSINSILKTYTVLRK